MTQNRSIGKGDAFEPLRLLLIVIVVALLGPLPFLKVGLFQISATSLET
jgi:hypothetical protein